MARLILSIPSTLKRQRLAIRVEVPHIAGQLANGLSAVLPKNGLVKDEDGHRELPRSEKASEVVLAWRADNRCSGRDAYGQGIQIMFSYSSLYRM